MEKTSGATQLTTETTGRREDTEQRTHSATAAITVRMVKRRVTQVLMPSVTNADTVPMERSRAITARISLEMTASMEQTVRRRDIERRAGSKAPHLMRIG